MSAKSSAKLPLLLLAGALVAVAVYLLVNHAGGPQAADRRELEAKLQPLLASHAGRDAVRTALGTNTVESLPGTPSRRWLDDSSAGKSDPDSVRLRAAAAKHSSILQHSSGWTEAWVFFDGDGRLQEYVLREQ